jgi:hypothetical protein
VITYPSDDELEELSLLDEEEIPQLIVEEVEEIFEEE